MSNTSSRFSPEECARRGREIFEREVAPRTEATNDGQVAAIDVESGQFEIADDTLSAADALTRRLPNAQIWFARIGQGALHRIGAGAYRRTI